LIAFCFSESHASRPGCRSVINGSRDFLVRDFATMLPKDRVLIEILETIQMDWQVASAAGA
jgi:c-di-GMP-related signal transduction protein